MGGLNPLLVLHCRTNYTQSEIGTDRVQLQRYPKGLAKIPCRQLVSE